MTIYQDMLAAGVDIDSHASDLYVRDCEAARAVLKKHGRKMDGWNVQNFRSAIDGTYWLDIPFAYEPAWQT